MTGKEPMLKPTAPWISKGYSSRSLQVKPLLSVLMISVFVAELRGYPVDTKIMGTEKKKKLIRKAYIIYTRAHWTRVWVRILALEQHSMEEYLPEVYNLHSLISLYKTQDHNTKFLKTEIHIEMNDSSFIIEKNRYSFMRLFKYFLSQYRQISI